MIDQDGEDPEPKDRASIAGDEITAPDNIGGDSDPQIDVLLVDDNHEWAEFVGREIDANAEDIAVTVATSANEALLTFESEPSVDCVIADYWMPEITGLELLERIREERPSVPFILITGEGSEEIAEQAIQSRVDDYIVKNPSADQVSQLVRRIRTTVERHRLATSLRESEARYRAVVERSRDAIVALRPEEVLLVNERATTLTGRSRATLRALDFVESVVHPDDRERLRRLLRDENELDHRDVPTSFEARILREDGSVRHCEFGVGAITLGGDDALLCSIHDVTPRRRRERQIERERNLNRLIQRALVETHTRSELEAEVCEALVAAGGYETAWIGAQHGSAVERRAAAGRTGYLDAVDFGVSTERAPETDGTDREPTLWAMQSREPQFVSDLHGMFSTSWQTAAEEAGYRSMAALPLVHNDILYGVVSVYHTDSDRFDETERQLLTDLADTLAFAVDMRKRGDALLATEVTQLGVQLNDVDYYLSDVLRSPIDGYRDARFEVQTTEHTQDGNVRQIVDTSAVSPEAVQRALTDHEAVAEVVTISADEDGKTARFGLTVEATTPEERVSRLGGRVTATTVTVDGVALLVELPQSRDASAFVEEAEESLGSITVTSVTGRERETGDVAARSADGLLGNLTEKQAEVLRTAFYHGYFDQPRGQSSDEVADALGIARSTFLQHLRAAQRKVFETVVQSPNE
jgi:PAS domain S-box-containing protein